MTASNFASDSSTPECYFPGLEIPEFDKFIQVKQQSVDFDERTNVSKNEYVVVASIQPGNAERQPNYSSSQVSIGNGQFMKFNRREMLVTAGFSGFGMVGCLCGCRSAPMTGRPQMILMPESQEVALGLQAYTEVISSEQASQNVALSQLVSRVGNRIAMVSDRTDFEWEFRLIASEDQNAFCLPGGKVAVYEGIMPVCENEAGLAVVMAHEVAHALARHGGERMSQSMLNTGTRTVVDKIVRVKTPDKADLLMQAYGMASEYGVILPYSRKQESEADHIGVMLMARAGYDPNEAPRFWKRFSSVGGEKPPEFMSTHPSDDRRAADLLALMGEASGHYQSVEQKFGRGQSIVEPGV